MRQGPTTVTRPLLINCLATLAMISNSNTPQISLRLWIEYLLFVDLPAWDKHQQRKHCAMTTNTPANFRFVPTVVGDPRSSQHRAERIPEEIWKQYDSDIIREHAVGGTGRVQEWIKTQGINGFNPRLMHLIGWEIVC